jgi:hypothetical protein
MDQDLKFDTRQREKFKLWRKYHVRAGDRVLWNGLEIFRRQIGGAVGRMAFVQFVSARGKGNEQLTFFLPRGIYRVNRPLMVSFPRP